MTVFWGSSRIATGLAPGFMPAFATRVISKDRRVFSLRETLVTSFSWILVLTLPSWLFCMSSLNERRTRYLCFHSKPSLQRAGPSFNIATPPIPSLFMADVERGKEDVWERSLMERPADDCECRLSWDIFPGIPTVEGIRLRRGRSVGGRGAGPGFMNWPGP